MTEINTNAAPEFPLDDTKTDLPTLAVVKAPKKKASAPKAKTTKPKSKPKLKAKKVKAVKTKVVKKAAPAKIKIKRVKLAKKTGKGKVAIVTYIDSALRAKIVAAAKTANMAVARWTRDIIAGQFS